MIGTTGVIGGAVALGVVALDGVALGGVALGVVALGATAGGCGATSDGALAASAGSSGTTVTLGALAVVSGINSAPCKSPRVARDDRAEGAVFARRDTWGGRDRREIGVAAGAGSSALALGAAIASRVGASTGAGLGSLACTLGSA